MPDLRVPEFGDRVAQALDTASTMLGCVIDRSTAVRKRRTVGGVSDRGTWVRVEGRTHDRVRAQGWGGIESAAALSGVAMPRWHGSCAWAGDGMLWRADELELVVDPPVLDRGVMSVDPDLPDGWWATLRSSMTALAGQPCAWPAKVDPTVVTQESVTAMVAGGPGADLDPIVDEWAPAHADLHWRNVTAPRCRILDWEDWGRAPRGLDAATLLLDSLAVPSLAARVRAEFAVDLDTRTGRIVTLALCSSAIPGPARAEAERLAAVLRQA